MSKQSKTNQLRKHEFNGSHRFRHACAAANDQVELPIDCIHYLENATALDMKTHQRQRKTKTSNMNSIPITIQATRNKASE